MLRAHWRTLVVIGLMPMSVASAQQQHLEDSKPPRILCRGVHADKAEVVEGGWVRLAADGFATSFEPIRVEWSASAGHVVKPRLVLDRTYVLDNALLTLKGAGPGWVLVIS